MNSPKRLFNKKQIELQFDRAAARYDLFAHVQREMASDIFAVTETVDLDPATRVLDLGCETGELLSRLQGPLGPQLTGLDLSQKMLDVASTRCPTATFVHADMESIPWDDQCFDMVISNASLQWCDLNAAVSEMFRVLATGGKVIVGTLGAGTLRQWVAAFDSSGSIKRVHPFHNSANLAAAFHNCLLYTSDAADE